MDVSTFLISILCSLSLFENQMLSAFLFAFSDAVANGADITDF